MVWKLWDALALGERIELSLGRRWLFLEIPGDGLHGTCVFFGRLSVLFVLFRSGLESMEVRDLVLYMTLI